LVGYGCANSVDQAYFHFLLTVPFSFHLLKLAGQLVKLFYYFLVVSLAYLLASSPILLRPHS
jgi:hypothetical protein